MNGAIGKAMGAEQQAAGAEQAGQPAPDAQGKGVPATPQEEQALERAVLAGVDVIFDDKTKPTILKMLQAAADDPASAIAQTTMLVIQILEEQSKGKLPDVIILDLANELGGNIMALGAKQGIFQADENLKGKAAQQINLLLNEMYQASPEDAEEMMAGMSEEELAQIQTEQAGFAGGA